MSFRSILILVVLTAGLLAFRIWFTTDSFWIGFATYSAAGAICLLGLMLANGYSKDP